MAMGVTMRRWLVLQSYHVVVLILFIGACSIAFAWTTYGLVSIAMANVGFLRQWGVMAVMEGGLWQTLWLVLQAMVSLFSYLGFKGAEYELLHRWRTLNQPGSD